MCAYVNPDQLIFLVPFPLQIEGGFGGGGGGSAYGGGGGGYSGGN